jgi:hypothetical protein
MIRLSTAAAAYSLSAILVFAGCSQNTEKAGSAETQTTPAPAAAKPAAMPQDAIHTGGDGANGLGWTAPSGWIKEQPASQMRAAQYRIPSGTQGVKDGELAVFFFGAGQGGGTQANLERWAGQFTQDDGSDPMQNAKVQSSNTPSGLKVTTIALKGHYQSSGMGGGPTYDEPGWRLFGAVVEGPGGPWFFKMVGPDEVIQRHHDEMIDFLKGLRTTG